MFCAVAIVVVVLLLTYHLPVYPGLVLNLWASYLGLLKLKSTNHHTRLVLLFTLCIYLLFVLMEVWSSEDSLEESVLSFTMWIKLGSQSSVEGPEGSERSCWSHVLLLMLHLLVSLFISAVLL